MHDDTDLPDNQFLAPELVMTEMAEAGAQRAANRSATEVLVLSMIAGGFITVGALFSTLIATGTTNEGVQRLLEGFGFSVGFFAVVLTGTLLFTEVNVEMPATLLSGNPSAIAGRVARLWILAAVGNFAGTYLTASPSPPPRTTAPPSTHSSPRSSRPRCATATSAAPKDGSARALRSTRQLARRHGRVPRGHGPHHYRQIHPRAVDGLSLRRRRIPPQPRQHGLLLPRPTRRPRPRLGTSTRLEHRPRRGRQHRRRFFLVALPFWALNNRRSRP